MKKKLIYKVMTLFLFILGSVLALHHYDTIKQGALEHSSLKEFSQDMLPTYQRYILALAGDLYEGITVNPNDRELFLRYVEDYKKALEEAPIHYYAYNHNTGKYLTNLEETINYNSILEDSKYFSTIKIQYNHSSYPTITEGGIVSTLDQDYLERDLNLWFKSEGRLITDKMDALTIKECTFIFMIEKEDIGYFASHYFYENSSYIRYYFIGLLVVAAFLAMTYTAFLKVDILKELQPYRFFKKFYFEILIVIIPCILIVFGVAVTFFGMITMSHRIDSILLEIHLNPSLFAVVNLLSWVIYLYMASLLMFVAKYIASVKVAVYLKEHTFIAGVYRWMVRIKNHILECLKKIKGKINELLEVDFHNPHNRALFLALLINAIIMSIACVFFVGGWLIVVAYTIGLFVYLRKKFQKIQLDYQLLLASTHSISKGDFDIDIGQDLGSFNPLKEELSHIRDGFRKAVHEEVKSQKLKTELITNVSHDLKTPLTSMMTYVDLLKNKDVEEQKRDEYIEVLERNTRRLKKLIEDLFEISKVNSGNVDLELVDVDLGSLILQTYYECKLALDNNKIDVRFAIPEGKHLCRLDSFKTYRIFENLFMNISKYALSGTRAYIVLENRQEEIILTFKNISREEMEFDVEEITERFVRGDDSRNTQGSGLGLAIVKSFTELQKGTLKIETDGDLFKAIVVFKK